MTTPITTFTQHHRHNRPHSTLTLTIVAWLLFVSSSASCIASSVHQPRVSTCMLNDACLAHCSAQLTPNASWSLPTENLDSHSIACTLPPSSRHIALCVAFFDDDHTSNRVPTSASLLNDRGPIAVAADVTAVNSVPSPHALEIVHSGPLDGGFVWCLARQTEAPSSDSSIAVVAVSAPPKLFAVLLEQPATATSVDFSSSLDSTGVCNVCNGSDPTALLLFTCSHPFVVVGSLIAILCILALVAVIVFAMALCRRATVKIVTMGATSPQSIERVASWLGFKQTLDYGLFVLPFRLRFFGKSSQPATIVLYTYIGRPMDANSASLELRNAIASNESSRTICVVMTEGAGSHELLSRLRETKIAVIDASNKDREKARSEILNNL